MSDRLDHRKGREANEAAIADRLRRINQQVGSGQLSDAQIREEARKRANAAAERGVRDEKS